MTQYALTTINVQGDDQEAYEVYADESREQTIAFCFTEEQARLIAAAPDLLIVSEWANGEIAQLRQDKAKLRQWLGVLLNHVDYTSGACTLTEHVGAVLPHESIEKAKAILKATQ